ncbi:MAG: oxidoreductase, partial [Chloroflexota bacterium]|nr:oxidoreductase [Chloroflexota bacterium]
MTLVLPLGIPWFAAVSLAALDGRRRAVGWLAVGGVAAGLLSLLWLAATVLRDGPAISVAGGWPGGVGIVLRADMLGLVFAVLSVAVILIALIYEVLGGLYSRTFPALVLFMATGLTGLCLTGDVFSFYVFFEISMISAYALTAYGGRTRQIRAALIFATVNLLGSVLFLIAIAALYHLTGTLEMTTVAKRMAAVGTNPSVLTATLIFTAFSVKLGIFPFHWWLPAVYTGTRPTVAAILSAALANIGSYGLLRFGAEILPRELRIVSFALLILGTASIVYGALQALSRHVPSEMLAYSSIGQVGYILIALAIGGPVGYAAAVLYAVVNALNKTLLFLSAGLRGPLVQAAFAIGAFSVAGIPPSAGFFGKVALFGAGIESDSALLVALIFLGGALSFVYMFQV